MTSWRLHIQPLLARIQNEINDDEAEDEAAVVGVCAVVVAGTARFSQKKKRGGGSQPGKSPNLDRGRAAADQLLYTDYFAPRPLFPEALFRRRFLMSRRLFARIVDEVTQADSYFTKRPDATDVLGFSPRQKVTAALRMLCYGICADATDEYVRIAESTALDSLKHFVMAVLNASARSTCENRLLQILLGMQLSMLVAVSLKSFGHWTARIGFGRIARQLGMECTKTEMATQLQPKIYGFGTPLLDSLDLTNDTNVVDRSPLMVKWLKGNAPAYEYEVNGNRHTMCYLLCDGIYPNWYVFVKSIRQPETPKEKHFAGAQESVRKDVERCFGVLKGRFGILAQPAQLWDEAMLRIVWRCCVALHNMIIEDEREENDDAYIIPIESPSAAQNTLSLSDLLNGISRLQNQSAHAQLQRDIIEHQWNLRK
ncbi:Uncharacterized protein PHPALM_8567 [Phytophthora palmivora]|uniref:DDE Tnp4 domain-containing protein n=1 Tax=Phytophthora palmivora TaxID=4796 RepID=A0A2P4Y9I3_9STRA|nr:Uncharacterized protein PHPALM_8567 [Phytophthora palmivora]